MKTALAIGLAIMTPLACWAFEPQFEGEGQLMADTLERQGVVSLPIGPFASGWLPSQTVAGDVSRRSWRISRSFRGTGVLAASLEAQLRDQDYEIVFACETDGCGGFDFRFAIDVLLPPKMFVDLSDFFFISAKKDTDAGVEAAWILVSQTVQAGMVQVEAVVPADIPERDVGEAAAHVPETAWGAASLKQDSSVSPELLGAFGAQLIEMGHVVLGDLSFETGASRLADQRFASLEALAGFLSENPKARVALVGHTDSQGALDVNTRISEQRARAVLLRLVERHEVDRAQLEARGAGYLAPIASNDTEEGRDANRRVEAVLLSAGG